MSQVRGVTVVAQVGEPVQVLDDERRPGGGLVIPNAPLHSGAPSVANGTEPIPEAALIELRRHMGRAAGTDAPFPAIRGVVGSDPIEKRAAIVQEYFYQRRESFVRALLAQRPELRERPEVVQALADQWVARNVARYVNGQRDGLRTINERGMLVAIDAEIRRLEAANQPVPQHLLDARDAASRTTSDVRAAILASLRNSLRGRGLTPEQIEREVNNFMTNLATRVNTGSAGWEDRLTNVYSRPGGYKPVEIPPPTPSREQSQHGFLFTPERVPTSQARIAFEPHADQSLARGREERLAANEAATEQQHRRLSTARAVAATLEAQGQIVSGPLSSLV